MQFDLLGKSRIPFAVQLRTNKVGQIGLVKLQPMRHGNGRVVVERLGNDKQPTPR